VKTWKEIQEKNFTPEQIEAMRLEALQELEDNPPDEEPSDEESREE